MNLIVAMVLIIGCGMWLFFEKNFIQNTKGKWVAISLMVLVLLLVHGLSSPIYGVGRGYYIYMSCTALLVLIAIYDFLLLEVPVTLIGMMIMVSLTVAFQGDVISNIKALVIGLGIIAIMSLVSRLTSGAMGLGDGLVIGGVALLMGWQHGLYVLIVGLLLAAVTGVFLIIIGSKNRRSQLPFVPFIALAHVSAVVIAFAVNCWR